VKEIFKKSHIKAEKREQTPPSGLTKVSEGESLRYKSRTAMTVISMPKEIVILNGIKSVFKDIS
jgi:hypothetical protein